MGTTAHAARELEEENMYSELWDVDVNHYEEVYVVRDEMGESDGEVEEKSGGE